MASGSVVTFLPIQEGEGDPSPTNIRPIRPRLYIDGIGPIYGGTLNPSTGELVKTNDRYVSNGLHTIRVDSWSKEGTFDIVFINSLYSIMSTASNTFCNILKPQNGSYYGTKDGRVGIIGGATSAFVYIIFKQNDFFGTTAETCLAKLQELYENGTPFEVVYPLQPRKYTTYHLTPSQLNSAIEQLHIQMPSALEMRRRIIMARKPLLLPSKYQQVEYIEYPLGNDANPLNGYIDTGVIPNQDTVAVGKFYKVGTTGAYINYFGSRSMVSPVSNWFVSDPSRRNQFGYWYDNIHKDIEMQSNTWYEVSLSSTQGTAIDLDNDETYSVQIAMTRYPQYPIFIFARNQGGVKTGGVGQVRCGYFRLIENGVYIRNMIPCYRKSDNKPGMYDLTKSICPLTNSPFYISANEYEFICGPDVN